MIRTLAQLAEATGEKKNTLQHRTNVYPIKGSYEMVGKTKFYDEGVLEAWHQRVTKVSLRPTVVVRSVVEEGAQAYRMDVAYSANPYSKVDDIQKFCAWCAGWNDEKTLDTQFEQ
jgi:hypothetical protein